MMFKKEAETTEVDILHFQDKTPGEPVKSSLSWGITWRGVVELRIL